MKRALELMGFETAHRPRPHVNALVRPHHLFTPVQRLEAAVKSGWNVFQFPSEMLQGGDLLSDSGTTTPTVEQFSQMMLALGDTAYGTNWGYPQLVDAFRQTFGDTVMGCEMYFFHQGRSAEHALYSHLGGRGLVVPSNSFFDTTRANAEAGGILALDLPDASNPDFGGNIDLKKLEQVLDEYEGSVPFVLMTVTNNTGGGQPVSLRNLQDVYRVATAKRGISVLLDMCRFAENAWFIKHREEEFMPGGLYERDSINTIVTRMFSYCDGFTISLKKDGLANMGGALVLRQSAGFLENRPNMLKAIRTHQFLTEGHPTQGGISARDQLMIAEGLKRVICEDYLAGRIGLVHDFGSYLAGLGVPVVEPFGGHAVYIDTDRFFADTDMRREDFGGISLTALLLLKGVRLCELGAFAFGRFNPDTGAHILPERNYVRAAVPRNKYERDDLYYVADCIKELYDRRHELPRAIPVYGQEEALRHMVARFELKYR